MKNTLRCILLLLAVILVAYCVLVELSFELRLPFSLLP